MTREMPSMTAVAMPPIAQRSSTLTSVSQRVAPSARLASRMPLGTFLSASSEIDAIVGTHMKASMIDAFVRLRPVARPKVFCSQGARMIMPMKPITTEGSAAMSSIMGFTTRFMPSGMPA